jgi:hypothetical protein
MEETQKFFKPAGAAANNSLPRLGASSGFDGAPIPRSAVAISTEREIRRRQRKLSAFNRLVAAGFSQMQAAKRIRVSLPSLWRWQHRLEPQTGNCGRTSILEHLAVPAFILERVRRLQLAGRANAAAWQQIANDSDCPDQLAQFLRQARSIPPSFLRATRLERIKATAIRASGFVFIQPTKHTAL